MRRIFGKQATITPFEDQSSYQAQQTYTEGEDVGWEQVSPRGQPAVLRGQNLSNAQPRFNDEPMVGNTGYSSYGEVHSMPKAGDSKGRVSRKASINKPSAEFKEHRDSKNSRSFGTHSVSFQKRNEDDQDFSVYSSALQQQSPTYEHTRHPPPSHVQHRHERTSSIPLHSQLPNHIPYYRNDADQQSFRPPQDQIHSTAPLQNPHDRLAQQGVVRQASMGPTQGGSKRNLFRGRQRSQTKDDLDTYHEPPTEHLQPWSLDRGHDRGRVGREGRLDDDRNGSDVEIKDNVNRDAQKSFERYTDIYDDAKQGNVANEAGKEKMKRIFFRKKKQQQEHAQKKLFDESHLQARIVDEDSDRATGDEYGPESMSSSLQMRDKRDGRSSPVKKEFNAPAWLSGLARSGAGLTAVGKGGEDSAISVQIGWLCSQDESLWLPQHTQPLFEAISHSEANSKEAAKVLRKEFKYAQEEAKFRAIKLWAVLFCRLGDRFRLQIATKRFLEVVEDLYNDKNASTRIRGRLLVALSVLAFESQNDADLQSITKLFNKVRPAEMPANGIAFEPENELFRLPGESRPSSVPNDVRQPYRHVVQAVHNEPTDRNAEVRIESHSPTPLIFDEPVDIPESHSAVVDFDSQFQEDIRRMHEECNVARSNAQLLSETILEDGLEGPLLAEFAEKTQLSHDYLSQQIPWASSQSEQSQLQRQEPGMTVEEELLQDLLDAHEKVTAAQAMMQEAQERQREDEEEAQVMDRSMREMRMDRSTLVRDPATGHLYNVEDVPASSVAAIEAARASGSRSVSPARRPLPPTNQANVSTTHSGLLAPPMHVSHSAQSAPASHLSGLDRTGTSASAPAFREGQGSTTSSGYQGGPRPMQSLQSLELSSDPPSSFSTGATGGVNGRPNLRLPLGQSSSEGHQATGSTAYDEGEASSEIVTPIQPSEKALGKRRAMSIQDDPLPNVHEEYAVDESGREDVLLARPPPALPSR